MANNPKSGSKFKTVEDDFGVPWKPTKEGEAIEGVYCGSEEVQGTVGDAFTSYRVKDAGGIMHGVSGATLEKRMARIPGGAEIRVTYQGTQKSKRGSDMKLFKVDVAEGVVLKEVWEANTDNASASA